MKCLVIVQCGNKKIWDDQPNAGATPAEHAYVSAYFQGNKEYAKRFGDKWMILSAKFGFIDPSFMIPCNYNVTFKKPSTGPISAKELREQVMQKGLHHFDEVEVLGGCEYVKKVKEAFEGCKAKIIAPLEGLSIGLKMNKVRCALETGRPLRIQH